MNFSTMLGALKVRYIVPIYQEEEVVGQKKFYESLGYIMAANPSAEAADIIDAFGNLFQTYSVEQEKTFITYKKSILDLVQAEEGITENANWEMTYQSEDTVGGKYNKNIGYFPGELTTAKIALIEQLGRNLASLSTNSFSDVEVRAEINPYEE